jgi:hypothetical protein
MRAFRTLFDTQGRCKPHKIFPGSKPCGELAPNKKKPA